eukprot:TRINITY_DN15209_c0_g1_i1.p1 TRINITY_DN15209_c0_g1~~TRINITY_DN15209_c0_g1_i1.p1  ORF type:complete len:329 (-),score=67.14 TRINITY_DN15209_c0_g1_i1:119-976(-)
MNLSDALDECILRFLSLLPAQELQDGRLLMNLELAWWFYTDFLNPAHENLPKMKFPGFSKAILARPAMKNVANSFDFNKSQRYKRQIPRYGTVLFNHSFDKIVLVQDWYTKSWMLPQGKVDELETPYETAVRETIEETGFDPTLHIESSIGMIQPNNKNTQPFKGYFVCTNVPEDYSFVTTTRFEIRSIKWFPVSKLPKTFGVKGVLMKAIRALKQRDSFSIGFGSTTDSTVTHEIEESASEIVSIASSFMEKHDICSKNKNKEKKKHTASMFFEELKKYSTGVL